MSARLLFAIGVALLAISVPTAQGCNIVADRDAATRMGGTSPARDVLSQEWGAVRAAPDHSTVPDRSR